MKHFLIVYRRSAGKTLCERSFGTDHHAATTERSRLERQYRHDADVEVIVLTASSPEAMRRTHARYFKTLSELTTDLHQALSPLLLDPKSQSNRPIISSTAATTA